MVSRLELTISLTDLGTPESRELVRYLARGNFNHVVDSPAVDAASSLLRVFRIRYDIVSEGGRKMPGLLEAVTALAAETSDERVSLYSLEFDEHLFSVFVRTSDSTAIGCIRIR